MLKEKNISQTLIPLSCLKHCFLSICLIILFSFFLSLLSSISLILILILEPSPSVPGKKVLQISGACKLLPHTYIILDSTRYYLYLTLFNFEVLVMIQLEIKYETFGFKFILDPNFPLSAPEAFLDQPENPNLYSYIDYLKPPNRICCHYLTDWNKNFNSNPGKFNLQNLLISVNALYKSCPPIDM